VYTKYTYKGFTYEPWEDREDDNVKIFHDIHYKGDPVKEPGWFRNISPYTHATKEQFEQACDEIYFELWVKNRLTNWTMMLYCRYS